MSFADHVGGFDACQRGCGRIERFEGLRGAGDFLDETMVLLDDIIEVFHLRDVDQPTPVMHHQEAIHVEQS
ncbi:hypothetical protein AB1E33_26595 [Ruegeria sp. 2012CJ15-1]|uniref:hypothetical protein n=1 Tax=Ruegeria hyattellae TaxID=3233337 RepID=UPI00355B8BC4